MKRDVLYKIASYVTAATLLHVGMAALTGCAPRDEVLKIYNWGDYIDEDLLDEFEDWYKAETGKNITVDYETFDTNEDMIMRIEVLKADYDLVCPSDYMAERMINGGLALPFDPEIFSVDPENLYGDLAAKVQPFDDGNEYYAPYVWGTFGIMYDVGDGKRQTLFEPGDERMKSWQAMWTDFTTGGQKRTLMKDSVRDAYSIAQLYINREKLKELSNDFTDYNNAEYKSELKRYFSEISDESILSARDALIEQKKVLHKYEVDDGKNDMLAGTTPAWMGFFWSCDVGLIMQEKDGGHFYYEVPEEGSNIWVDGWIIPKYAKNTTAANYFLKFINLYDDEYDVAMRNFDYLGSSVASKAVMEDAKADLIEIMYGEPQEYEDEEDAEYAEMMRARPDWFKQMYIDMMFPTPEVLSRCEVMRDFGKARGTDLDSMWIDVKTMRAK